MITPERIAALEAGIQKMRDIAAEARALRPNLVREIAELTEELAAGDAAIIHMLHQLERSEAILERASAQGGA